MAINSVQQVVSKEGITLLVGPEREVDPVERMRRLILMDKLEAQIRRKCGLHSSARMSFGISKQITLGDDRREITELGAVKIPVTWEMDGQEDSLTLWQHKDSQPFTPDVAEHVGAEADKLRWLGYASYVDHAGNSLENIEVPADYQASEQSQSVPVYA